MLAFVFGRWCSNRLLIILVCIENVFAIHWNKLLFSSVLVGTVAPTGHSITVAFSAICALNFLYNSF
jgi:hypothetical protein